MVHQTPPEGAKVREAYSGFHGVVKRDHRSTLFGAVVAERLDIDAMERGKAVDLLPRLAQ
jgi:hypothetical protein